MKYARIHEYGSKGLPGGVIKAKTAKGLLFQLKIGTARSTKARIDKQGRYHAPQTISRRQWVRVMQVTMPERAPLRTSAERKREAVAKLFGIETGQFLNHIWGQTQTGPSGGFEGFAS